MRRFVFHLETLLGYRQRLEGLAENEYRRALAERNQARERLREIEQSRAALLRRHEVRPGAVADVRWLELLSRCAAQLRDLGERQASVVLERDAEAEQRLADWHRRRRDAEVIRRLKQKKRAAWVREAEREEQKTQDDLFIAKKAREGRT